jgi:hypothetical protein
LFGPAVAPVVRASVFDHGFAHDTVGFVVLVLAYEGAAAVARRSPYGVVVAHAPQPAPRIGLVDLRRVPDLARHDRTFALVEVAHLGHVTLVVELVANAAVPEVTGDGDASRAEEGVLHRTPGLVEPAPLDGVIAVAERRLAVETQHRDLGRVSVFVALRDPARVSVDVDGEAIVDAQKIRERRVSL